MKYEIKPAIDGMSFTPQQFGGKPSEDATEALQQCFDAAAKAGGEVYLSPGTWRGNVLLKNVKGMTIRGDSRLSTTLYGIEPGKPALRIEGFWYSRISDLGFGCNKGLSDCGVLEIDSSDKQGVQANTYERLLVNGQGSEGKRSKYAMTMCRVGTSSAQGSEQLFMNCHFSGAIHAAYYQEGFNALNNTIIGGNFQNYDRCGIDLVCGSLQIFSVGFQSCVGDAQIDNDGWDIRASAGGVGDAMVIAGCRTESLRFFKGNHAQPVSLISCLQVASTERQFNVVELPNGTISNCTWNAGKVIHQRDAANPGVQVSEDYACTNSDRWVFVNPKNPSITITLCDPNDVPSGREVVIVRAGGTSGEVCVAAEFIDNVNVQSLRVADSARFISMGGHDGANRRWYKVK
jgi:hypothetical protein